MARTTKTKQIDRKAIIYILDLLEMMKNLEMNLTRYRERYHEMLCTMNDATLIELSRTLKRKENKQ